MNADDLFNKPAEQAEVDFAHAGGETFICGNPPYRGSTWQSADQKSDLEAVFGGRTKSWKSLDYVAGWFMKAADFGAHTPAHTHSAAAFVATNSICQGQQVPILWPLVFGTGHEIAFAHTSFKWSNLARHNAGVTVAIVGISNHAGPVRHLYALNAAGQTMRKDTGNINAWLVAAPNVTVRKAARPLTEVSPMSFGNKPVDGGHLLLSRPAVNALGLTDEQRKRFIRRIYGSAEFIHGLHRYCLWITDADVAEAMTIPAIRDRIERVRKMRLASTKAATKELAERPFRFGEVRQTGSEVAIIVPRVSSENREYLPVGLVPPGVIVGDRNFALYDAPLWNMALIASRLHRVWIATVCGRLKTDFSYSNTLGWNTFPLPRLTEKNQTDLTRLAEDILLTREANFPATIAELYDPKKMPANLRAVHDQNDEKVERIVIGRRFRNDTERQEKLFTLYARARCPD